MSRRRKVVVGLLLTPLVLLGTLLLYLGFADLSPHRGWVAREISRAIGRQILLGGPFRPRLLSGSPTVVAEDIVLTDPDGGRSPGMVQVDRLEGRVSLWSLFASPIRIEQLRIQGAHLRLGADGTGSPNWVFASASADASPPADHDDAVPVAFGEITIERSTLLWDPPDGGSPILLEIDRLELVPAEPARHRLLLEGELQHEPVRLAGTVTRLEDLLFIGRDVAASLEGRFGTTEISLHGGFSDLFQLAGPALEMNVRGGDPGEITRAFSLPPPGEGPYRLELLLEPRGDRVGLDLDASLGAARAEVSGTVAALTDLSEMRLAAKLRGPDLRAAAALFGTSSLPPVPFHAHGSIERREEGGLTLQGVELRAGDARASLQGRVGAAPGFAGTDLDLSISGDSLQPYEAIAGVRLPAGPFEAVGRLRYRDEVLQLDDVNASVGGLRARVDGSVGAWPGLRGTDLAVDVAGPSLAVLRPWVGMALPDEPFTAKATLRESEGRMQVDGARAELGADHLELSGSFDPRTAPVGVQAQISAQGPDLGARLLLFGLRDVPSLPYALTGRVDATTGSYRLSGVEATLGGDTLRAGGDLGLPPSLAGTDLAIEADGADLSRWGPVAGTDLPAEPWSFHGRVGIPAVGYELEDVRLRLGADRARLQGYVGPVPDLDGTALHLEASGPDLRARGSSFGVPDLPAAAWSLAGDVRRLDGGYALEGAKAVLGPVSASASGRVGAAPDWDGTELDIEIASADLATAAAAFELPSLPPRPLRVEGHVGLEEGLYRLTPLRIAVGDHELSLDGVVNPHAGLAGTSLRIEGSGLDHGDLFRMASEAGWIAPPPLPDAAPWQLRASLEITPETYEIGDARLQLGPGGIRVDGTVGATGALAGTRLRLDASGADAALLGSVVGLDLPRDPYRVRGEIRIEPEGYGFDEVDVTLGERQVTIDGTLGAPPGFTATRLQFHAQAPGFDLVERLTGRTGLPPGPVSLSVVLETSGKELVGRDLLVSVASSDLSGDLRMRPGEVPRIEATLRSTRVDLAELLRQVREPEEQAAALDGPIPVQIDETASPPAEDDLETAPVENDDLALSSDPFRLDWMALAEIDVRWEIDQLLTRATRIREFTLGARMDSTHLEVDPLQAESELGGQLQARMTLDRGEAGVRIEAEMDVDAIRLARLAPSGDISKSPPVDVDLRFEGIGHSLHEMLSSADGRVLVIMHEGEIDNSLVDTLAADFLVQLLNLFNPFKKEDPTTRFECGLAAMRLDDGVLRMDPIVARTDKITVVGDGRVRFENEALRLTWAIKPRKGIGVSATALTNSYIKLGGTLGSPSLTMKPLDAVVSTGAAVMTMGLSLLARGMWDRATAERKVCRHALKEVAQEDARRAQDAANPARP